MFPGYRVANATVCTPSDGSGAFRLRKDGVNYSGKSLGAHLFVRTHIHDFMGVGGATPFKPFREMTNGSEKKKIRAILLQSEA
jgi:hypothetical protein